MAKLGVFAVLTVLAVVPFVATARSLADEEGVVSSSYRFASLDRDGDDAAANGNGLYFSLQSLFQPTETARCADIDGNGNVVMADCKAGSTNQLWSSEDTVIKHYTGKCLEVCVTNCHYRFLGRKRVWIRDCTGEEAQQWLTLDGSRIKSVQNGNCVDVCDSRTCSPRGDVITYGCHDESNQQWGLILGGYAGPSQQVNELRDFSEHQ